MRRKVLKLRIMKKLFTLLAVLMSLASIQAKEISKVRFSTSAFDDGVKIGIVQEWNFERNLMGYIVKAEGTITTNHGGQEFSYPTVITYDYDFDNDRISVAYSGVDPSYGEVSGTHQLTLADKYIVSEGALYEDDGAKTYEYDKNNRIVKMTIDDVDGIESIIFNRDANGDIISPVIDGEGEPTYIDYVDDVEYSPTSRYLFNFPYGLYFPTFEIEAFVRFPLQLCGFYGRNDFRSVSRYYTPETDIRIACEVEGAHVKKATVTVTDDEDGDEPYIVDYEFEWTGGEDGIRSVSANHTPETTTYYNLSGQQLQQMQHGLSIVRSTDGTVRKVLQK